MVPWHRSVHGCKIVSVPPRRHSVLHGSVTACVPDARSSRTTALLRRACVCARMCVCVCGAACGTPRSLHRGSSCTDRGQLVCGCAQARRPKARRGRKVARQLLGGEHRQLCHSRSKCSAVPQSWHQPAFLSFPFPPSCHGGRRGADTGDDAEDDAEDDTIGVCVCVRVCAPARPASS